MRKNQGAMKVNITCRKTYSLFISFVLVFGLICTLPITNPKVYAAIWPPGDLQVTMSVNNSTPNVGDNISYSVSLTNLGPDNALNAKVTGLLPTGLSFVSANPSAGTYDNHSGVWTVGTVTTGTSQTLNITAIVVSAVSQTFTVSAVCDYFLYEPNPSNNDASISITPQKADLQVTMTVSNSQPNFSDVITYAATLTNNGPDTATNVEVDALLPTGVSYVSHTASGGSYNESTGKWTIGTAAIGSTEILTLHARVDAIVPVTFTTVVSHTDQYDPITDNNSTSATINPVLDNTAPTVVLSSSASDAINAAFPVTVTFSEQVSGFTESDIVVGNGTVSNLNVANATTYTATITPSTSGQAVTVDVGAGAAADAAGNGNTVSNTLSFNYDTTKPTLTFGGFTSNQIFSVPPSSISVSVSDTVYWVAGGAQLNSYNALPLISMVKDSVTFSAYTASYDEASRRYILAFNSTLGDGTYEVKAAGSVAKNVYGNTLDAASQSFTVAVPTITGITVNPTSFTSGGGNAIVTITGSNLTGQTVKVYVDGAIAVTAAVNSPTSASATVTIPRNATASALTRTLTVDLNGAVVAAQSATVTVSGSTTVPPTVNTTVIDQNGVALDPATIDTTKPSVTLEVTPKDGVAYVSIPASILTSLEGKNATFFIEVKTPYGIYRVPVNLASLISGLKELLASNNLKAEDISFKITLADRSGDKDIQAAFTNGLPSGKVMGTIVDFSIEIINTKTGQTLGTADKFSKALARVIPMPENMLGMPSLWGAFRYNDTTKKFEFVPANKVQIDGVWYVMISSYSNSVYVVAENTVKFTDVNKHWSQSYVELAAAKGLVEGVGGRQYDPNKSVTRAEFTAMLVRAIGRGTSTGGTAPYDDVKSGAWYFNVVATAKELGLLNFASEKSFKPDQPLTREEMASMLAAVIALEKLPLTKEFVSLDGYKDIDSINATFLEDVRLMVKLEIMTGIGTDKFDPKGETTRAQAAVVFIRTLKALGMIDG